MDLTMPDYMSEITTLVQTEGSAMSAILIAGAKNAGLRAGKFCGGCRVRLRVRRRLPPTLPRTLRALLFDQVQSFTMGEIGQFSTASLITRSTNDVMQVQMFVVMGLQVLY